MNQTIYRQYDSRWGSKPYPTKSSTFSGNGCGCVACTHILIELNKYKNTTPEPVRQYMVSQGFAVARQGTSWSGIPKTLNHYGFKATEHATMPEIFEVLDKRKKNKQPCLGVILFGEGSRGGVTWTSGGHYVAFTDYKVENGKHYFYTKDSGPRCNDGWHAYETTMRGLIPKIWSAAAPAEKGTSYQGSFPTAAEIKSSSNAGTRAYMLKWAKEIVASGKYKYKRFTDDPKTHQCPICHPGSGNGWNCMGYAIAIWKHGGKLPCNCSCAWFGDGEWDRILKMNDKDALAYAQRKTGLKDVAVIRNGGKTIPNSKLMAGDILGLYDGNDIQHIVLYVGNGKITDSTSGRKPNIAYGVPMYKEYQAKVAIRYTGGKSYMQFFDRGTGVRKLKDFLLWYNPKNKFANDDVFGTGTLTAVEEFQEKEIGKGQGDGLAGPKTFDVMSKYKK